LESGPTPIYVGFGSIVVDDPDAFTRKITTQTPGKSGLIF
jgi:hypothetical protein